MFRHNFEKFCNYSGMAPTTLDASQNGNGTAKHLESAPSLFEIEDSDLSRLLDKPRPLNIERKRSFDERSFSEMFISMSPPHDFCRNTENSSRAFEHLDSPGRRSGFNTPRSSNYFEPHPIVGEAWDALRRSLVYFHKKPVGTIAALDHSAEKLNYDQVKSTSFNIYCHDSGTSECFP